MPEMTPLELAKGLEVTAMWRAKCPDKGDGKLFREAAYYLRKIANGEYKQVVHARWIANSDYPDTVICSACGCGEDVWWADNGTSHCPYCGSLMDGKEGNE